MFRKKSRASNSTWDGRRTGRYDGKLNSRSTGGPSTGVWKTDQTVKKENPPRAEETCLNVHHRKSPNFLGEVCTVFKFEPRGDPLGAVHYFFYTQDYRQFRCRKAVITHIDSGWKHPVKYEGRSIFEGHISNEKAKAY